MAPAFARRLSALVAVFAAVMPSARGVEHPPETNLATLRQLLRGTDGRVDLAAIKLKVDRLVDPSIDIAVAAQQLDAMVTEIRGMLPAEASSRQKLEALRRFIYERGPWNGGRPFEYDLDDPFGRDIRNKLLPIYLAKRKGNCVSMPLLFIILGQKLGLDLTAARAPEHIFVKYRDESGTWFSIETTSGGHFARDAWLRQQMPMTDRALASGVYMRPLTMRETAVVTLSTLMEFYLEQGWYEELIPLAALALEQYPKDVESMVLLAVAYARLWGRDCVDKYPRARVLRDLPEAERARCERLNENATRWASKAEALGWLDAAPDTDATYLRGVSQEKKSRAGH